MKHNIKDVSLDQVINILMALQTVALDIDSFLASQNNAVLTPTDAELLAIIKAQRQLISQTVTDAMNTLMKCYPYSTPSD